MCPYPWRDIGTRRQRDEDKFNMSFETKRESRRRMKCSGCNIAKDKFIPDPTHQNDPWELSWWWPSLIQRGVLKDLVSASTWQSCHFYWGFVGKQSLLDKRGCFGELRESFVLFLTLLNLEWSWSSRMQMPHRYQVDVGGIMERAGSRDVWACCFNTLKHRVSSTPDSMAEYTRPSHCLVQVKVCSIRPEILWFQIVALSLPVHESYPLSFVISLVWM